MIVLLAIQVCILNLKKSYRWVELNNLHREVSMDEVIVGC